MSSQQEKIKTTGNDTKFPIVGIIVFYLISISVFVGLSDKQSVSCFHYLCLPAAGKKLQIANLNLSAESQEIKQKIITSSSLALYILISYSQAGQRKHFKHLTFLISPKNYKS